MKKSFRQDRGAISEYSLAVTAAKECFDLVVRGSEMLKT
jgi:hypothetical protein